MVENYPQWIAANKQSVLGIQIQEDIEPAQGKLILSRLDNLYGPIRLEYGEVMKRYKDMESSIYRIEHKGRVTGRNDMDRKANGISSVENFRMSNGEVVNLYTMFSELLDKKEDLEALLDIIKSKNNLVITMSGLLKIESNFAGK